MSRIGVGALLGAVVLSCASVVFRLSVDASPPEAGAQELDGSTLFLTKGCAACHNGPDSSSGGNQFPSLLNVAEWADDRRPGYSAAEYVTESIAAPAAFRAPSFVANGPTASMPQLGLTASEIERLVDYLLTG